MKPALPIPDAMLDEVLELADCDLSMLEMEIHAACPGHKPGQPRSAASAIGPNCRTSASRLFGGTVSTVDELASAPLFSFADWPNDLVPRRAAGVYTIWRADDFIYVGMSGRGAQREDFVAGSGLPGQAKGLWTRLKSHASGRRSGDQFNIYICDRFIVPVLTSAQQIQVGRGDLLLDQMTRSYIRENLGYRFTICADGTEALAVEQAVRCGALPAGRPYLNPL